MSGIYIHIPFCKQACNYCNFHFATSLRYKTEMLQAIHQEITARHQYFDANNTTHINSIYIGGGTPSLLNQTELLNLFDHLSRYFNLTPQAEITLEANPDDLNPSYLNDLRQTPINRLSIGIQSFFDEDLRLMNRAHHAIQAIQCIENAQQANFNNLSIDLIYGIPTPNANKHWQQNLEQVFSHNIPHFSAYCLTIEPKTPLEKQIKKGKIPPQNEEQAAQQFEQLIIQSKQNGYCQYEISNFCLPDQYARHNTAYWQGKNYLGIGPSAHSFNGTKRQWNIANNTQYIKKITEQLPAFEEEILTSNQQYNEYIMTSLRTTWGTNLNLIENRFGKQYQQHLLKEAEKYIQNQLLTIANNTLYLSENAKFLADGIISNLMIID